MDSEPVSETNRIRNSVEIDGHVKTPDTTEVKVLVQDDSETVLMCSGTTAPSAEAGYSKGCLFIKNDAGNGVKSLYENIGTTASCDFNLIGDVTEAEIANLAVTTGKLQNLAVTTAKIAEDAVTSDKLDVGTLKFTDVEITAIQLKAIRATAIPLVVATEAGAGKAIIPMAVSLKFDAGTEVLTETADNLAIKYAGGAEAMTIETTGLIDQATDQNRYQGVAEAVLTPVANTALVLQNTGDGEIAGNVSDDAKLYVRTFYRVVPVL